MDLPMVDCRSLIEFCRAFERHRNMANQSATSRRSKSLNPLSHPFCDHSPFAAIDAVTLLLVIGAIGFLTIPYFKLVLHEAAGAIPAAIEIAGDVVFTAPFAYGIGMVVVFAAAVVVWELCNLQCRKCGNPYCRGLREAVEFDIQLQPEECLSGVPGLPEEAFGVRPLKLGHDHKELEAELKKMAPLNGRTVLIFRARCGCPLGRLEVLGPRKVRRIKK